MIPEDGIFYTRVSDPIKPSSISWGASTVSTQQTSQLKDLCVQLVGLSIDPRSVGERIPVEGEALMVFRGG
jgi:hypothetical protein